MKTTTEFKTKRPTREESQKKLFARPVPLHAAETAEFLAPYIHEASNAVSGEWFCEVVPPNGAATRAIEGGFRQKSDTELNTLEIVLTKVVTIDLRHHQPRHSLQDTFDTAGRELSAIGLEILMCNMDDEHGDGLED